MNTAVCFLIGLIVTSIAFGVFHLWVRLWYRIIEGRWRFDREMALPAHMIMLLFTAIAVPLVMAIYCVGCWLRGYLHL